MVRVVALLMAGEVKEQSLGQREETKLLLEKIVLSKAVGRCRGG